MCNLPDEGKQKWCTTGSTAVSLRLQLYVLARLWVYLFFIQFSLVCVCVVGGAQFVSRLGLTMAVDCRGKAPVLGAD